LLLEEQGISKLHKDKHAWRMWKRESNLDDVNVESRKS